MPLALLAVWKGERSNLNSIKWFFFSLRFFIYYMMYYGFAFVSPAPNLLALCLWWLRKDGLLHVFFSPAVLARLTLVNLPFVIYLVHFAIWIWARWLPLRNRRKFDSLLLSRRDFNRRKSFRSQFEEIKQKICRGIQWTFVKTFATLRLLHIDDKHFKILFTSKFFANS